jgi:hypothetical protein
MSIPKLYRSLCAGALAALFLTLSAFAQSPKALTGTVTSDAEGAMEGVLVKAKKIG